jgi:hypothetical protein
MARTIKPGRPHSNGITNQQAKFPDGAEIELITAPAAVDGLTRAYRRHLASGDGPAFLALFAPPPSSVTDTLAAAGFAFTAQPALVALTDDGPLPYIFPGPLRATVARFAEGDVVLLPGRYQLVRGRKIVGLTVKVADIGAARRVLGNRAGPQPPGGASASTSVFVGPEVALGYWLEFR